MKLARLFFRPRWQSKDPAIRAGAVTDADDAELIAALPEIARSDEHPRVRWAALRRLDRLDYYSRAVSDDGDPRLREDAAQLIRDRIAGKGEQSLALEERLLWLQRSEDSQLVDYVLAHGKESELRAAALARTTRPGALAEIALNDNDGELRLAALERIQAPGTLERIAREARRKDKRIARRAREMLDAQVGANDLGRDREQAEHCCRQLEAELAQPDAQRTAALMSDVDARWQALGQDARQDFEKRYRGLRNVLEQALNPTPAPSVEERQLADAEGLSQRLVQLLAELGGEPAPDALPDLAARMHGLLERAQELDRGSLPSQLGEQLQRLQDQAGQRLSDLREALPLPPPLARLLNRVESLAAQSDDKLRNDRVEQLAADWASEWQRLSTRNLRADDAQQRAQQALSLIRQRIANREAQREQALLALPAAIESLQGCIADGDLARSRKAMLTVQKLRSQVERLPEDLAGVLHSVEASMRELDSWEQWSNNAIRDRLIEQAQGLLGSGLHPDAVATRVRELQAEWTRLDKLEHDPAQPKRLPAAGMAHQFRDLCRKALEPAQGFFDKRSELRAAKEAEIAALCVQAEADSDETPDLAALQTLRRGLGDCMRELSDIEPRNRKAMAERLRAAMARLDAVLDAHFDAIETRRKALVERAAQAATLDDRKAAADQLKTLQREWQAVPRGRRRTDQAMWNTFREHCDSVFGELKAERTQEIEASRAARAEARSALDQLLALPLDSADALATAQDTWREQRARVNELVAGDAALQSELSGFEASLRSAAQRLKRQQRSAELLAWLKRADTLVSDENWPSLWSKLPGAESELAQQLRESLQNETENQSDAGESARRLCVQMEFLAGIDSPDDDRELRMDHQVSRLSARLAGEADAEPAEQQCQELLIQWCRLIRAVPHSLRQPLSLRMDRATRSLLETS